MTGEVTLQGRVLPIGGLKQKVLAAHAAGLTDVIIPERNRADLDDVPADVREAMTFHPVMTLGEVLDWRSSPGPPALDRCRSCKPVPEEVRRAADLLERRWMLTISGRRSRRRRPLQRVPAGGRAHPPRTLAQRLVRARGGRRAGAARSDSRPPRVEYLLTRRASGRGRWSTPLERLAAETPAPTS